jgi:hypothetical protein
VYPHIRDFTYLAEYPPLKPKVSYFVFTTLTTRIVNSRKIARWARLKILNISPKEKYF